MSISCSGRAFSRRRLVGMSGASCMRPPSSRRGLAAIAAVSCPPSSTSSSDNSASARLSGEAEKGMVSGTLLGKNMESKRTRLIIFFLQTTKSRLSFE